MIKKYLMCHVILSKLNIFCTAQSITQTPLVFFCIFNGDCFLMLLGKSTIVQDLCNGPLPVVSLILCNDTTNNRLCHISAIQLIVMGSAFSVK